MQILEYEYRDGSKLLPDLQLLISSPLPPSGCKEGARGHCSHRPWLWQSETAFQKNL